MAGWKVVMVFRHGADVQALNGEDGASALIAGIQLAAEYNKSNRFHLSDEL